MIIPDRKWSVNLTKEALLKEIDEEIQKEYQILNKFSSEKFSIILIIFGFFTILVTILPFISSKICTSQAIFFYLIAFAFLITYWTYWEKIKNSFFKKDNKQPDKVSNLFKSLEIFSANERIQFKHLLIADWQFAKKGEPHFKAFSLLLWTIIVVAFANIQGWISIPHLNDSIFWGVTITQVLIVYSLIIIISIFNPNVMTIFWEKLFYFLKMLNEKPNTRLWIISRGIYFIVIGGVFIGFWTILFNIFPIVFLVWFVLPNAPVLLENFVNNLVILLLLVITLNFLIEFLASIFGINLVECVKNEKIWWLEKIKLVLCSEEGARKNDNRLIEGCYKKFDYSDLYVPIPIQRFFTFQKYVLFPIWVLKPTIDVESCDEMDFAIMRERFNSQKDLIYQQKPL